MLSISRRRTVHLAPIIYPSGTAHMLSLIFSLVVVSWLSVPCNALPGILAPQTSGVDYGPPTAAWTPQPTAFVENVHKRDALVGNQTCGFFGGNHCKPTLTCLSVFRLKLDSPTFDVPRCYKVLSCRRVSWSCWLLCHNCQRFVIRVLHELHIRDALYRLCSCRISD